MFKRLSFNNMFNKGWDSAAQESYCWQQFVENDGSTDPDQNQFWWVPEVWRLHGHADDFDEHTRDDKGRYVRFPAGLGEDESEPHQAFTKVRLLRLATLLPTEKAEEAELLISLASSLD